MRIKPNKIVPVKYIIEIEVKVWSDKYYGQTYKSGRAYINYDYENPVIVEFNNDYGMRTRDALLTQIDSIYGLKDLASMWRVDCRKHGIYIAYKENIVKKAECIRFGKPA